ncbi:helix-turn-helix transcriptional regulator [Pseudomonas sp. D1-36]|uniref:helix-turn-helix transcriptional regulator n=1 Tax=Pseudomonas sp. D1-36 TaxID=2817387 RepID=UPI003DA8F7C6
MAKLLVQPRILRVSQAPAYLGMCRDEFNKAVRPNVREFPIGKRGVGFDRVELDAWADAYIAANAIEKHPPTYMSMHPPAAVAQPISRRQPGVANRKMAPAHATKEEFERLVETMLGRQKRKL